LLDANHVAAQEKARDEEWVGVPRRVVVQKDNGALSSEDIQSSGAGSAHATVL